ncbi:MAG: HAMP domain-containing sensor histidine kinase [Phascolarctobacterium sp.]|nr:HAMP domain-containing sensor histidine kinase [Phascolarctobacterium sp.]
MWSKVFEHLRQRMTCIYAAIFGVLILLIVFAAYTFIWWNVLQHEKDELVAKIYHEAEEWVDSGEEPCSAVSVREGSMLAYFVSPDGKTVVLDQLGQGKIREGLFKHRGDWPKKLDTARMLNNRVYDEKGNAHRYLAALAPVLRGDKLEGHLYMFKDMEFYYQAAFTTLFKLLCVAVLLFALACYFGYWLAGRNIQPISEMYGRQMQFTADASHEMRTPLAVMALATQGLKEDEESRYSDFAKESIEMLQNETQRMSRLTENLMALARGDEGNAPAPMQMVNITELCARVGQQLKLLAQEKGIALRTHVDDSLELLGDETALNRLLIILLDNAIKYSPAATNIDFIVTKSKNNVLFVVQDEGCGISDEDKEKVFDRFYRVDKARSRSQGGLGLGLSLAHAIVRQHQGEIRILDNKPCGTIMQVLLPLNKA